MSEPNLYRCSICGAEISPAETVPHLHAHQQEPDWPGHLSYCQVGGPFDLTDE